MEEVDAIILHSLREIGCNIDDDAKLKTLTPEEIFKCLGRLCKCIKPDTELLSTHLPAQMAQRFAAASQLVDCCKSLGFNGDLGYQTILYSNPIELRRIFMWLIERIPKSEDKVDSFHQSGDVSQAKALENAIISKIGVDLKRPWLLEFLQPPRNIPADPIDLEKPESSDYSNEDLLEYKKKFLPPVHLQTKNLIASIISTHDKDLLRSQTSVYKDTTAITQKLRSSAIRSNQSLNLVSSPSKSFAAVSSISEEVEDPKEEKKPKSRFDILSELIDGLKEKIEDQEDIYRQLTVDKKEQLQSILEEKLHLSELKEKKKLKERVTMLLDDPEENKLKLQQSLEVAKRRKETLNNKFETHRDPLLVHLESFSGKNAVKLQRAEEKINSIRNIRQMITEIQDDIKNKTATQQNLQAELNQMKRVTERSAYTSRIIDIIKSIKRQNNDINEILKDTKAIQKAINSAEGQLQRQFTVTEDLIWNNTNNKDEYSKKAYKLLITLHTEFSELINLIENTGSTQREIRELEDQIDNERQHNVQKKLEQITKDLEMINGSI